MHTDIRQQYDIIREIDRGAFGAVLLARNKETNKEVAIKRMNKKFRSWEECLELREVKSLMKMKHPNIVKLIQVLKNQDELFLVFEFVHTNLYKLYLGFRQRSERIPESLIKSLTYQVLSGLAHIHKIGYFHRDMKPENLLVTDRNVIKIADFGLAKELRSKPPFTDYVSTRWYRAPELLLKAQTYNGKVDVFALGCIVVELYLLAPLFAGENEVDQLSKIISVLGTPPQEWVFAHRQAKMMGIKFKECEKVNLKSIIPGASSHGLDLIERMLAYDPLKRISATDALIHPYFSESLKTTHHSLMQPELDAKFNNSDVLEPKLKPATIKQSGVVKTNLGSFDPDDSFGIDMSPRETSQRQPITTKQHPKVKESSTSVLRGFDEAPIGRAQQYPSINESKFQGKPQEDFDDELDFFFTPSPGKRSTDKMQTSGPDQARGIQTMKKSTVIKLTNPKGDIVLRENQVKAKKDIFEDLEDFLGTTPATGSKQAIKTVTREASLGGSQAYRPAANPSKPAFDDSDDWDTATKPNNGNRGFLY